MAVIHGDREIAALEQLVEAAQILAKFSGSDGTASAPGHMRGNPSRGTPAPRPDSRSPHTAARCCASTKRVPLTSPAPPGGARSTREHGRRLHNGDSVLASQGHGADHVSVVARANHSNRNLPVIRSIGRIRASTPASNRTSPSMMRRNSDSKFARNAIRTLASALSFRHIQLHFRCFAALRNYSSAFALGCRFGRASATDSGAYGMQRFVHNLKPDRNAVEAGDEDTWINEQAGPRASHFLWSRYGRNPLHALPYRVAT